MFLPFFLISAFILFTKQIAPRCLRYYISREHREAVKFLKPFTFSSSSQNYNVLKHLAFQTVSSLQNIFNFFGFHNVHPIHNTLPCNLTINHCLWHCPFQSKQKRETYSTFQVPLHSAINASLAGAFVVHMGELITLSCLPARRKMT